MRLFLPSMGGGNSPNLIKIPSLNEVENIIVNSDLNGSITPGNLNTWQFDEWHPWWTQNNSNEYATMKALKINGTNIYKNRDYQDDYIGYIPLYFYPVIEFKE